MDPNMRARVTKRERKLHVSYELPHRVHSAHVYPITAPNGSTVIIYGYSDGLRILWRGGRRRKEKAKAHSNGVKQTDMILLDDDDDLPQQAAEEEEEYEAEEEEQDADCPYPGIIQHLEIPLAEPVLHVAIPAIHPSAPAPNVLRRVAVIATASANGAVRILQIPLALPSAESKAAILEQISHSQTELSSRGPIPLDLAVKILSTVDSQALTAPRRQQEDAEGTLLVYAASRVLSVWSTPVAPEELVLADTVLLQKVPLPFSITSMAAHPSHRSAEILFTDTSGSARIYDPHASKLPHRRPTSSDSTQASTASAEASNWVMAYHTSFHAPSGSPDISAALARCKKILDAKWVLAGKGIFALLEDGEWGIWDVAGSVTTVKNVEAFVVNGFLGHAGLHESAVSTKPGKGNSKLAPMTPNTRKSKAEQLFTGAPKVPGVAPRGGISVSSNSLRHGHTDESVALWYNSDIYSITSMQQLWQRSTTSGGSFGGSLHAPGLTHITEVDLMSENVTSISHFSAKPASSGTGHMNTQRDLLISTEHRVIILQTLRPPTPPRNLFQQQLAERPALQDQQMLDTGTLGLDGVDRMLDNMDAANPATRKVGFATH